MDLIRKMRPTQCHYCGCNSLVMITIKGKEIPIRALISNDDLVNKTVFTKIRCPKCGREFEMDWSSHNNIPEPLTASQLSSFDKGLWS